MRTLLPRAAFGCAAFLLIIPRTAGAAPPDPGGEAQVTFVDADDPATAGVRRTGEAAIRWLGAKLAFEVKSALTRGAPEDAVASCHLKTVSSGGQVLPGMPSVVAFKLTSERLLNAANAPDAADQAALERVRRVIAAGETPDDLLVQRIKAPDGSVEWRVYRPLAVLASCLACHGDPVTQSPRLRTRLSERAPANAAIGYAEGEWRGLLRVTVVPPAAMRR